MAPETNKRKLTAAEFPFAFANMSKNPKQEFLSDGITEEIITALLKTPKYL